MEVRIQEEIMSWIHRTGHACVPEVIVRCVYDDDWKTACDYCSETPPKPRGTEADLRPTARTPLKHSISWFYSTHWLYSNPRSVKFRCMKQFWFYLPKPWKSSKIQILNIYRLLSVGQLIIQIKFNFMLCDFWVLTRHSLNRNGVTRRISYGS